MSEEMQQNGAKKIGLLPRLILAIIAGILIGAYASEFFVRILITLSGIFGNFLSFVIPLIIIGFVAPGIGDLGKGAGKILGLTVVIAYVSTIFAGSAAFFVDSAIFPKIIEVATQTAKNPEEALLAPLFVVDMPPLMDVMTALLFAFVLGIGMSAVGSKSLSAGMHELQHIIEKLLSSVIIPLLPLLICGTFANMTYAGQVQTLFKTFAKVYLVVLALHLAIIFVQYLFACFVARKNPFRSIAVMFPAYMTAIGTQSSAATIPVTLRQTKKNGVRDDVADFVIPLCATIHLSGSTITLTSCSIAVMMMNNMPAAWSNMFPFILMLGVVMVAAPGVPGGAVMAAMGILDSILHFSPDMISLMIALYLAQDSFGTACNVTGDGAIAILVDKLTSARTREA
ncbi:MAG: dicarboxylate/amino acid:cation symporter [Synergistaceae bacterium]|jgi:Na+/H+-dicarboxylate symporter|nr:dicarboxylate/amino acid:cation symporter [Synergistaceae bacterium]